MIGLGAMGVGMAASLLRAGYPVCGYDVFPQAVSNFLSHPGQASAAKSPADAAEGAEVVIIMVQNASQVSDVLFGAGKVAECLSTGATVILSSTVPPHYMQGLQERLDKLQKSITLLDAPVSGGVIRAASGNLMVCIPSLSAFSRGLTIVFLDHLFGSKDRCIQELRLVRRYDGKLR